MASQVSIAYEDPDKWEEHREKVYEILEQYTGTREYPETKSLPPILFGAELPQEAIEELRALNGVIIRGNDD